MDLASLNRFKKKNTNVQYFGTFFTKVSNIIFYSNLQGRKEAY